MTTYHSPSRGASFRGRDPSAGRYEAESQGAPSSELHQAVHNGGEDDAGHRSVRGGPGLMSSRSRGDLLDAAEESRLLDAWMTGADAKARDRLILAHLPLVMKTASGFKGYGLAMDDLIAEGNVGLVRALDSFEAERGLRFSTYAQWWIRAAMYDHVLRFSTPASFPITADRKKVFFKLKAMKTRLLGLMGGHLDREQTRDVAGQLKVSPRVVAEMDQLLSRNPRSLDAPISTQEGSACLGELLADDKPGAEQVLADRQERALRRQVLARHWQGLSEREKVILQERQLREKPSRLEDLAKRFGVSRERVRQIEGEALRKLKRLMLPQVQGAVG